MWRLSMRYERPAVERRVKEKDPVIPVATTGSPVGVTPTWAPHEDPERS
jgi:hypothetical protein